MKKLVMALALVVMGFMGFAKTIHVKHAYLMNKYKDGYVYKIRVQLEDGYHDWYVRSTDKPWLFYGFEGDDEIIVDVVTDIAVVEDW